MGDMQGSGGGSAQAKVRNGKRSLRILSAVVMLGLAGTIFGVQASSQASESSAPVLTASSSTSQVVVEDTYESDGAQATELTTPVLTASSVTSWENMLVLVASDASVQGLLSDGSGSGGGSSSSEQTSTAVATETQAEDSSAGDVGESFSMDVDCALCHTDATEQMQEEGYTGALHSGLSCINCHDNEEELTEAHAENYSAKQASRVVALVSTTVDEEICYTCHGDAESLAEATADSTVLTDSNGTTINPHDLPDIDNHVNITCGSCHKMHDDKTTEEGATNACLSCHHDNVYECGTCHVV